MAAQREKDRPLIDYALNKLGRYGVVLRLRKQIEQLQTELHDERDR